MALRETQAVIVYQADKRQFIQDTFHNDIEEVLSQQYLRTTGPYAVKRDVKFLHRIHRF